MPFFLPSFAHLQRCSALRPCHTNGVTLVNPDTHEPHNRRLHAYTMTLGFGAADAAMAVATCSRTYMREWICV